MSFSTPSTSASLPPHGSLRATAVRCYLDRHAQAGRPTYVHCWGGIGRTGTVIGCHLVEQGHTGDEALAEVARLFATMSKEKLRNHPGGSPETDAQRAMVREWDHE